MGIMYYTKKKQVSKQQGYGSLNCGACNVRFTTHEKLMEHKKEKRAAGLQHIHCRFCGIDFATEEAEALHLAQKHPQDQELFCPGCKKGPFSRLVTLFSHIETGECGKIDMPQLELMRDKKTEFARKLVASTNEPLKHDFSPYLPTKDEFMVDVWAKTPGAKEEFKGIDESWPALPYASIGAVPKSANKPPVVPTKGGVANARDIRAGSSVGDTSKKSQRPANSSRVLSQKSDALSPSVEKSPAKSVLPHKRQLNVGSPQDQAYKVENSENKGRPLPHLAGKTTDQVGRAPAPSQQARDPSDAECSEINRGSEKPENMNGWTQKPKLSPPAPRAQLPAEPQLQSVSASGLRMLCQSVDIESPDHPAFNPARHYCSITEKFLCPKTLCMKRFKTANALTEHLRSPAHNNTTYSCPSCLGRFKSLVAIISHVESASVKCQIREKKDFGAFLDQLTAGLVDVSLKNHEDGSRRYEIPDVAKKAFDDGKKPEVWGWEMEKSEGTGRTEAKQSSRKNISDAGFW